MAHSIPRHLSATLALPLFLSALALRPALACSCRGAQVEGFIHPEATVLPANAQGVLFHAPSATALKPSMFAVASAAHARPPRIRITTVRLPPGHPMRQRLPGDGRLVRVGIAGGFTAGARYTVTYQARGPSSRARHSSIAFDVDQAPLDLSTARLAIALDGRLRRTLLSKESTSGSCSESVPALVQDFHVALPAGMERYAPALSLLGEARDATPGAAFKPLTYSPSLCASERFDRTALGAGRDMLHRACSEGNAPIQLRAWAGMLEVSNTFVRAGTATTHPGDAAARSCAPFGMLREAIERNDAAEAAYLSCQLGEAFVPELFESGADSASLPTPAQWTALARQAAPQGAACARSAMQRMLLSTKPAPPALVDTYVTLAGEALRGPDPAAAAATLDQLATLGRMWREPSADPSSGRPPGDLLPLLPDLRRLADGGGPAAEDAALLMRELFPEQ